MSDDRSRRRQVFDALYGREGDPWDVTTSGYERAKYAATLATLPPGSRFRHILDVGCSFGTLTALFAQRADYVTAIDVSGEAIDRAQRDHPEAALFLRGELPEEWPKGRYDLIVLSEILYFLSADEIAETAALTARDLATDGLCLLVNWTGPNELPLSGDDAAELFIEVTSQHLNRVGNTDRHENFRIDILQKRAS